MEYQTLDHDKDEIRLLTISDNAGETVTCTLENVSLTALPKYKALSYCWGSETDGRTIVVNDVSMKITPSLNTALRQFQHENHGPLWIDAICINQDDVEERDKQVPRMAEIYSQATEVIVWIGPAEDGSDMAMALMKSFRNEAPVGILAPGGAPLTFEEARVDKMLSWMALGKLFARLYWRRTWIIQEVALARLVTIRCGDASIDWRSLRGTMQMRRRWLKVRNLLIPPLFDQNSDKIDRIMSFRPLDCPSTQHLPLTAALLSTKDQLVTDPRDNVYGILGICSDAPTLVPQVSYKLSSEDVFTNLTIAAIKSRTRLDFICYKSPYGVSSLQMPTWALDLSTPCFDASTNAALSSLSIPSTWVVTPEYYRSRPNFTAEERGIPTILKVSAFMIGYVDGLGAVDFPHDAQVDPNNDYGVVQADTSANPYPSDKDSQVAIFDAMTETGLSREHENEAKRKTRFKNAWANLDDPNSQQEIQEHLAFRWSTRDRELIFQSRKLKDWVFDNLPRPTLTKSAQFMSRLGEFSLSHGQRNNPQQGSTARAVPNEVEDSASHKVERSDEHEDIEDQPAKEIEGERKIEQMQKMLANLGFSSSSQVIIDHMVSSMRLRSRPFRRLLITSKGHIGNVHPQARKGDWICLIQGSKMPVVLRPKPSILQVIGDAWVGGYVEGYALHRASIKLLQEGGGEMIPIG